VTIVELYLSLKDAYRDTKDYTRSVARLKHALARLGPPTASVDIITTQALDRLVSDMRAEGYNNKTINRYLAVVSRSLRWLYDRDLIPKRPKVPKLSEGHGRLAYLTEEQAKALCVWLDDHNYGDVCIVTMVLLATGFRITELLSRTTEHLQQTEDGSYWLMLDVGETKNNQARAGYLSSDLGASLAYLIRHSGTPAYRTVLEGLAKASVALGFPSKVTPHVLRHTTASMLTAKGIPTATVKEYLGHKSIITTLKYTHVQRASLREAASTLEVNKGRAGVVSGHRICSPLRSHSATRPRVYQGNTQDQPKKG
jgi:site-specific recombinase XerD